MATQSSYAAIYSRAQAATSRKVTPNAAAAAEAGRATGASAGGTVESTKTLHARDPEPDGEAQFSHINVCLRIRPRQDDRRQSYRLLDGSKFIEFRVPQKFSKSKFVGVANDRTADAKRFVFSCPKVFPETASQETVYEETAGPVVAKALDGVNGTIFTYGQTGSGKTYTLTGGSSFEERGIIPRAIETYFRTLRPRLRANHDIQCTVSYVEIYNEHIFDLLNPENKGRKLEDWAELKLRETGGANGGGGGGGGGAGAGTGGAAGAALPATAPVASRPQTPASHGSGGPTTQQQQQQQQQQYASNIGSSFEVVGLQEVIVQSEEEAINLLFMGNVNRVTSETPMNNASSRSHCIFTLKVGLICSTLFVSEPFPFLRFRALNPEAHTAPVSRLCTAVFSSSSFCWTTADLRKVF